MLSCCQDVVHLHFSLFAVFGTSSVSIRVLIDVLLTNYDIQVVLRFSFDCDLERRADSHDCRRQWKKHFDALVLAQRWLSIKESCVGAIMLSQLGRYVGRTSQRFYERNNLSKIVDFLHENVLSMLEIFRNMLCKLSAQYRIDASILVP